MITGGAGFIGSHLAERLLADGDRVVVLDNFDPFYDPAVKERNVAGAAGGPRYRLERGDIRGGAAIDRAFRGESFEAVVHLEARGRATSRRPSTISCAGSKPAGAVRSFSA